MAETKIKAGQFFGVIGHGTDGYFLMTNADGSMSWSQASTGPSVTSVDYPGDDTAADPAGGQTVVLTGTGFGSSMTVSIGGTTAPSVAHDSSTQLTITTPAKAAGDYDIVVTNTVTGASGTFVNGISYNGIPTWTTAAGSLGTFESETTISTITLQATEPDGGTITFNITNGALPTGLSLTGANIDGTTTAESSTTLYSFTIEAIDDENQSTPRNFSITVNAAALIPSENFTINTYTGNGSTQSIEGKIGTAAQFNGSSSNFYISGSEVIDFTSKNYTISFFANLSSNAADQVLVSSWNATTRRFQFVTTASNKFIIYERDSSNATQAHTLNFVYSTNTWYHISIIRNSTQILFYVNGNLEQTVSANYNIYSSGSNNLWFGKQENSTAPASCYNGKLDQIRLFNKALSSSEVTTLYGENNASSTKSTTDIFGDSSGVALYEFEEGAKDTGGGNGYIGSGGIFNGSSSYIQTSLSPSYNTIAHSLWFWADSTDSTNALYYFDNRGGRIDINISGTGSNSVSNSLETVNITATTATSQWNHLLLVYTGWASSYSAGSYGSAITVTAYLNGSSIGTASPTPYGQTTGMRIGRSGGSYYFEGKVDQFRVFNKALSSSEVTTLYGETSASATKSTADIFDDDSGVALYELEGNANDSGRFGRGAIDEGQSAVFTGNSSNSWFQYPSPISGSTDSDFAVSCWVYNNTATGYQALSGNINSTSRAPFRLDFEFNGDGNVAYISMNRCFAGNQWYTTNSSSESAVSSFNINTWYHVVWNYTASSKSFEVFVNGNSIGTGNLDASAAKSVGSTCSFGTYYQLNTYDWNGKADQYRIYSATLSQSDINALASETNPPTANLLAHYKLDGDITDETGNYNGTSATGITYSDPAEYPTYDGTSTNVSYAYDGTPTNVSFVGTSFQPDLVWIKLRNTVSNHDLIDSVRGATKVIETDNTGAEFTEATNLTSFDTNGFTVGSTARVNKLNEPIVAWCWKAGGTAVSNTDGSITSQVSANPDAGFSIVKYTGTGVVATVGHGLSSAPELIIIKNTDLSQPWVVYNATIGAGTYLYLHTSGVYGSYTNFFNNTSPTSSVFTIGTDGAVSYNTYNHIAYCFHSVDGYQKVGSYNGASTTNLITTGFLPRFVLIKKYTGADDWIIYDSTRGEDLKLRANQSNAEDSTRDDLDFTSTGFTLKGSYGLTNASGQSYIYLAIA